MKKFYAWTLVLVLVLSVFTAFAPTNVKALDEECWPEVTIGELIDLAQSGTQAGDNSGHGNHQTRVVRTSHGEYVCYISDKNNQNGINEISVIKVDAENGTAKTVFSELKSYDTSQSCVIVDNDENVWMVFVYDDKLKEQFDGRDLGVRLAAYRIDAKTDEVDGYTTLWDVPAPAEGTGYGYSSFLYDPSTNCIYTIGFNGSDKAGDIYWFTFDIDELMWTGYGDAQVDIRHGYPFMVADGKGGVYLICQDDYGCSSAGYPEVGNNNGLSNEDLENMKTGKNPNGEDYKTAGSRWGANYCWDELDFYYIPDMTKSDFYETTIAKKDYSRVKGDQDYRYSYEGRMTNQYPNFQMNNGGDMIIDKDGNMHVVYFRDYIYAASTRKEAENTIYHNVYDMSDPKAPKLISSTALCEKVADGIEECYWRLYEDTEGNIYYINTTKLVGERNAKLNVYLADGAADKGYERILLATKEVETGYNINVANMRGNSVIDNTVDVIISMNDSDYDFLQIKINPDTEHDFDSSNLIVSTMPTCTEYGAGYRVCKVCGAESAPIVIEKLPHSPKLVAKTEATCGKDGVIAHYECEGCGTCFEDETCLKPIDPKDLIIPATGKHTFAPESLVVDVAPTCTKEGSGHYVCSVCGAESEPVTVNKAPHKLTLDEGTPATCGKEGIAPHYVCDDCGAIFEDETGLKEITDPDDLVLPATGEHTWGEWIVDTEATPEEPGSRHHVCEVCGEVEDGEYEYVPATGDTSGIGLYVGLMAAALVLGAAFVVYSRKKKA